MNVVAAFWIDNNHIVRDGVIAMAVIALAWAVGRVAAWALCAYGKRSDASAGGGRASWFCGILAPPTFRLVALLGLTTANHILKPHFPRDMRIYPPAVVTTIIFLAAILTVVLFLRRFFKEMVRQYVEHSEGAERNRVTRDFAPLLQRILMTVIYLASAAVILHYFRYDITSIVVSLGIGTIAIGLAAQDTLSNMIAGFMIMFDRPFRIGDRIELENKTLGDVTDIGIRSTRIRTLQNTVAILPNAYLTRSQVVNLSYPDHRSRVDLPFVLTFDADATRVAALFLEIAKTVPDLMDDPAPDCSVTGISGSGIAFLGTAWVADYADRPRAANQLSAGLVKGLRESGYAFARPDGLPATPPFPAGTAAPAPAPPDAGLPPKPRQPGRR
ncbi:MAG: mechanosensitive ion channel family protein [Acidobacteria bacterium]|nr:mechanosensitive ion channel family protein [Acidobacteriota bacterium]